MAETYKIRIHGLFESAHYLYDYHGPGKNEALHGHSFETEVFVENRHISKGISVDFLPIQKRLDELMKELDHKCLNTMEAFSTVNPTAENIAKHIYNHLKGELEKGASIVEVRVWEGPKHYASFLP